MLLTDSFFEHCLKSGELFSIFFSLFSSQRIQFCNQIAKSPAFAALKIVSFHIQPAAWTQSKRTLVISTTRANDLKKFALKPEGRFIQTLN